MNLTGAPCLLTMPTYLGTLAAARCLGRAGLQVTIAGSELLSPARWSHYATRFVHCPEPRHSREFLEWLLAFGEREPGHFLYPSSDEVGFLYAAHQAELARHFKLYQPPFAAIATLLDKKALHAACTKAGIATVDTWFPKSVEEAASLAPKLPFPLMIKPRTQVMLASLSKGIVVNSASDLAGRYRERLRLDSYPAETLASFGCDLPPMLQVYCGAAREGIYSVAGFVDESGQLLGARASVKVLQRPRHVGIGLCFAAAELHPEIAESLARLCRESGYYGVFEAEFIIDGARHMLIDFNPRWYGQMAFEIARGLPLPLFAWLSAMGDTEGVRELAASASRVRQGDAVIFCHRFFLKFLLLVQRATGTMTAAESRRWTEWYATNRTRAVDASADPNDRLPGVVHAVSELLDAVRHPRGFLRGYVLER